MNKNKKEDDLNNILPWIKEGRIKMKSKAHFAGGSVLVLLGAIFLCLAAVYLVSFILFSLRASGVFFVPMYGFFGIFYFLEALPWLLAVIAVILIGGLEFFAQKYSFVYKRPLVYSLLAITLIVILASFVFARMPVHPFLFKQAQEKRIPGVGGFYRKFGAPRMKDFHYGVVVDIAGQTEFTIENPRKEKLKIKVGDRTKIFERAEIKDGSALMIFGRREGDYIQALEIRKAERDVGFFSPTRMPERRFLK